MSTAGQVKPMMTIQESVRTCIRKYADFSGRAPRAEYWWWVLATTLVSFAFSALDGFLGVVFRSEFFSLFGTLFGLAILLPNLAVTARRLHDIGRTGWWQLVWFMVGVFALIPLVLGLIIGTAAFILDEMEWRYFWDEVSWLPIILGILITLLIWLGLTIWWLVWMVKRGQTGPNRFGPDPQEWEADPVLE